MVCPDDKRPSQNREPAVSELIGVFESQRTPPQSRFRARRNSLDQYTYRLR